MRMAKILGIAVGALIAVIVLTLAAVWLFVNPNDFKPRIAAAAKEATGRDLKLDGDIKMSVFPWVALELGPASLGNPVGFDTQPFVSFKHASVRVKLLPLLSKRLEVGRIDLDGLDLRMLKNAEGKGNWEGFGHSDTAAPAAQPSKPGTVLEGVAGIKLTNGRVSYQKITLANLSLETGAFAEKGVVPVTLHVDADRGVANEHASLDVKLDFSADSAAKTYHIAALNLTSVGALAGQEKPVRLMMTAPTVDVNLEAQTLSVPSFAMNAAGANLTGSLAGTSFVDALKLTGSVVLAPVVIREYAARLGVSLPQTRDAKALSSLALSSDFEYGGNAARLEKLKATLDDTHLDGSLAITDLATQAIKFALAVDKIDLDRYLPPALPPGAASKSADGATARGAGTAGATADPNAKPLDANGTLTVGSVHFAPLDLSNVKVTLAAKDKVLHVFPLKAQVDGGQYSGDITMDSRATIPVLSLDEHLTGVDVGKLLASQAKNVHVSGKGNVNIKATAHGAAADAITKTLNGRFDLNVANGAVEGMDLGYELGRAEALIRRQPLPNAENSKRTKFDAFKMSADIANGVAATKDLTIASAVLKVTGQGSANLPAKTLDFSLVADTLHKAGNTPLRIPVKVTGSMADPTIRPDIAGLATDQLKEKAKDLLQDKLKGLFGKP